MNPAATDHARALIAVLKKAGCATYEIRRSRRGHPRLYYTWQGRERFYVLPGTASDSYRGVRNAVADLRRELGVVRRKSARPRKAHPRAPEPLQEPHSFTILPDPFEKLERYRDPIERAIQHAEWRLSVTFTGSFEEWLNR